MQDRHKKFEPLNRIIRWTRTGLEYESDQRHADRIISELELETCKPLSTPCVQENVATTTMTVIKSAEMTMAGGSEAELPRSRLARFFVFVGVQASRLFERIDENGAALPLDRRRHN